MKSFVFAALGLIALNGTVQAQAVGTVGAVNQSATSTPPGAATKPLSFGAGVVQRERITTSDSGSAQITFLDKATMSIGRNSSVVIDKFAYDSAAGRGEMAASLSKGVLRFVGGQISHSVGAVVKTPVATIGIRGGVMTLITGQGCGVMAIGHFGQTTISNNVSSQTISRPGFAVCVGGANDPIPAPTPVQREILDRAITMLTSGPGQNGGAANPPGNAQAQNQNIGRPRLPPDIPYRHDLIQRGDAMPGSIKLEKYPNYPGTGGP